MRTDRRSFLRLLASAPGLGLLSCTDEWRYSREDAAALEAQLLWGGEAAQTHTIPNLLEEMDATRVEQALILPIAFGLPFGEGISRISGLPHVR